MRLKHREFADFIPILGLALLGLVVGSPMFKNDKLHERLTSEERREVFNSKDVPEYDVVPIDLSKSKGKANNLAHRVQVNAFGRGVDLELIPNDEVLIDKNTPTYLLKKDKGSPGGFTYMGASIMEGVQKTLESEKSQASLIVKQSLNGTQTITGHIGSENWVIHPVPERLRPQNDQRSENSSAADSNSVYHFVYKTDPVPIGPNHVTIPNEGKVKENNAGDQKSKMNGTVDVVYPQILVFIDNIIYESTFKRDLLKLVEYLVLYWNSVDLRFRNLEGPKVRLNIAGIVIADQPNVRPLTYTVATDPIKNDRVADGYEILDMLGRYTGVNEKHLDPKSYDIAFFMMPYSMFLCNDPMFEHKCTARAAGLTNQGGSCKTFNSPGKSINYGAAVVQERGFFEGINIAAHELGHLFGAGHDDEGDGHSHTHNIMGAVHSMSATDGAEWSQCTINQMKQFFRDPSRAACLYDKPKMSSPLPRFVAGEIYSETKHCRMSDFDDYYPAPENSCLTVTCKTNETDGPVLWTKLNTLDGTSCGNNRECFKSKCVDTRDIV